ncbi:MAG: alkaline phosphatase family protein [Candidatus Scalindua sp.]|nr:alkaline phosphatase family protein [Candidatus Scalindua sp.]
MPGEDSFVFKTLRPWPNERLKKAAIVGHTTTTTSRLWFRTGDNGKFTILLYESSGKKNEPIFNGLRAIPYRLDSLPQKVIRHDFVIEEYKNDTTYVWDTWDPPRKIELKPGTLYAYALYSDKEKRIILGHDRVYSFRTMPEGNEPYSFALYSCHMPYSYTMFKSTKLVNEEMWDSFKGALERHREKDLRFVIGGGDQVYTDGVESLSIWAYLNKVMRKEKETGKILPTQEDMVSWYRDIYRGYWGFKSLQNVFSDFPLYMMWDDHELGDGCGSYYLNKGRKKELNRLLPGINNKKKHKSLSYNDGLTLYDRMIKAAKQVYLEYQHSHNPKTPNGQYDYGFYLGDHSAFYFLDGRGYRDVQRDDEYRILGKDQLDRFKRWLNHKDTKSKKCVFVLAAVPVFHIRSIIANKTVTDTFTRELSDDLRDSWEHDIHDKERSEFTELLFQAAGKGQQVSILSGDVHMSAAFKLINDAGHVIYQLTSSAITYNTPLISGWLFGQFGTLPEEGETKEGYKFERRALYLDSNFSIIKVNPNNGQVTFQLYGKQSIQPPDKTLLKKNQPYVGMADIPITHSIARIDLDFTKVEKSVI